MTLTDTELAGIRLVLEDDPGYHSLSNRAVLRLVVELEAAGRAAAKFVFQSEPDRYAAEHPEQRDDDTPPTATRYCLGEPVSADDPWCGKCGNPIAPPSVRCCYCLGEPMTVCGKCGNPIVPPAVRCSRILDAAEEATP